MNLLAVSRLELSLYAEMDASVLRDRYFAADSSNFVQDKITFALESVKLCSRQTNVHTVQLSVEKLLVDASSSDEGRSSVIDGYSGLRIILY